MLGGIPPSCLSANLTQTAVRQFGNTAIIHVPGPTDGLDWVPFQLLTPTDVEAGG
jgi:hypothetical protein